MDFCLQPVLAKGRCEHEGQRRGCSYRFGQLVGVPGGATAARHRFVSNSGSKGRPPRGTIFALDHLANERAPSPEALEPGSDALPPCRLRRALRGLVAYG